MVEDLSKRIDDDWKRRAQLEKEQLAGKPARGEGGGKAAAAPDVKASPAFAALIQTLASQAYYHLGLLDDPVHGRSPVDLDAARTSIQMIEILDQRTRGNLAKEEEQALKDVLADLRMAYVESTQRRR